jgi:hypothetical protein
MIPKDSRRGERRWRSFHAWMRRLQNDWWTHGSRVNPRGVYLHMKETGVCPIQRTANWRERFYCDCFDFKLQGNYRFKNHPTGHESQSEYRRKDGWHDQRVWEERRGDWDDEVPVSAWGKSRRDRRQGTHPVRVLCCRCGYLILIAQVENGSWYHMRWGQTCEGCKEKGKGRNITEAA